MFSMLDKQTLCNQGRTHFLIHLWDGFGPDKKLSVLNQNVFAFDSQIQAYDLDICDLQACSRLFSHSFFCVDRHHVKFSDMWFSKDTDSHLSFDSKRLACLTWFWYQCLSVCQTGKQNSFPFLFLEFLPWFYRLDSSLTFFFYSRNV